MATPDPPPTPPLLWTPGLREELSLAQRAIDGVLARAGVLADPLSLVEWEPRVGPVVTDGARLVLLALHQLGVPRRLAAPRLELGSSPGSLALVWVGGPDAARIQLNPRLPRVQLWLYQGGFTTLEGDSPTARLGAPLLLALSSVTHR